jgi:hypothetical protein
MPSSWQSCPLEIHAPRPGQRRLEVHRQLDPRDGQWGSVKSGGDDARGEPRDDRGPAQPDHRRGRGIGAQHVRQVEAIRRLLCPRVDGSLIPSDSDG